MEEQTTLEAEYFSEEFLEPLERVQLRLRAFNEKAQKAIRENPTTAMLAALAVGYLTGRMASRR